MSTASTMTTTMLCLAALAGLRLSGVRCFVSTPDPAKAAENIVRWVLASDREWVRIIGSPMRPGQVDEGGAVLAALGLTPGQDEGITANQVLQRLVTHKSTTGSQFRFGVKVLGVALEFQFAKSLLVHTHLLSLYVDNYENTNPHGVRICVSAIQVSLVHFAGKAAFFGHPLDFFGDLNDEINEFLGSKKIMLNDKNSSLLKNTSALVDIQEFLSKLLGIIKAKVINVSQEYTVLGEEEIKDLSAVVRLENVDLGHEYPHPNTGNVTDLEIYNMIRKIDTYNHVNVKTVDYEFGENRFKITKYEPTTANVENLDE